jgi:hypothetical protein
VGNPSDLEAVVDVRVSGRSGTFTPTGLGQVTVAPGALRSVDVTRALARTVRAGEPVGLRLRSEQPVVAALRSSVGGDETTAAAAAPLAGPAAVTVVPGGTTTVQLTADATAARVRLTAYDARGGRRDGTTVTVGPGATEGWSPAPGAAYVVVAPSRPGRVSGAVGWTAPGTGTGAAAAPLTPLPLRRLRPPVRPGLP